MSSPRLKTFALGLCTVAGISAAVFAADMLVASQSPDMLPGQSRALAGKFQALLRNITALPAPAKPDTDNSVVAETDITLPDVEFFPDLTADTLSLPEAAFLPTFQFTALPDAPVVFTPRDRLVNALATYLADHGDGKGLHLNPRLPSDSRAEITSFYEANAFRPLWIENGEWTKSAQSLREQLAGAADDALDPADYPTPVLSNKSDQEGLAQAELMLSAAAVLYARDARGGRINVCRLSRNITPELHLPTVSEVLGRLSESADAGVALNGYNPQHAEYQALKKKLAEIRQSVPGHSAQGAPRNDSRADGTAVERLPLINVHSTLGQTSGNHDIDNETVTASLAPTRRSRSYKTLSDTGDQMPAAVGESSANLRQFEGDIVANMERWRWLPPNLGTRYIQVNVPEYQLRFVANGSVVNQSRVIVGKAQSPTPIFSGTMENVVINPSWTIPPSILKNEVLPGMARDPDYAAKRGYQVIHSRNGNITVRQPPGDRNALGHIKFLFPNRHSVYLHDTPSRGLFSSTKRAFSHGCVRVDQPFQFAEEVLGRDSWPAQKVRSLVGRGERQIKLDDPIPVHLTYFTIWVDANGDIKRFDDIYGFNRQVRAALGLKG